MPPTDLRNNCQAERGTPVVAKTSSYEPGASSYPRNNSKSTLASIAGTGGLIDGGVAEWSQLCRRVRKSNSYVSRDWNCGFVSDRDADRASADSRDSVRPVEYQSVRRDGPFVRIW